MKIYKNVFDEIISLENLFLAWNAFKKGKLNKSDVQRFSWRLEENIFTLHRELKSQKYRHGGYDSFYIHDPKQRHIHKATVRDRVLHHAVFSVLNPIFEPTFIAHSFSCRIGKGTHKGIDKLNEMLNKVSFNKKKPCFVLKCDIRKFFEGINHIVLLEILKRRISDDDAMWLLREIIGSFTSIHATPHMPRGLPIGNLTSQLFANVYLNEFDQYVKHILKVKHYIRYTDDFVVVSNDKTYLKNLVAPLNNFLNEHLSLQLHPKKVSIRKLNQGIDFLGFILFPHHRLVRTKTKQRIYKKLNERVSEYKNGTISRESLEQSLQSYLGILSHGDTYKFNQEIKNLFWFWLNE